MKREGADASLTPKDHRFSKNHFLQPHHYFSPTLVRDSDRVGHSQQYLAIAADCLVQCFLGPSVWKRKA